MGELEPVFGDLEPMSELHTTISEIGYAAFGRVSGYMPGDVLASQFLIVRQEGSLPVDERHILARFSIQEDLPPMQILECIDDGEARRYALDDEGTVRRWLREDGMWIRDDGDDPEAEMRERLQQFSELVEQSPEQFRRCTVAELLERIAKSQRDTP